MYNLIRAFFLIQHAYECRPNRPSRPNGPVAPGELHFQVAPTPWPNDLHHPPAQEVSFVVKNNKKDADGKRNELYLVNKVSGWFDPGEMAALVSSTAGA